MQSNKPSRDNKDSKGSKGSRRRGNLSSNSNHCSVNSKPYINKFFLEDQCDERSKQIYRRKLSSGMINSKFNLKPGTLVD
jgi:hypothetical protein